MTYLKWAYDMVYVVMWLATGYFFYRSATIRHRLHKLYKRERIRLERLSRPSIPNWDFPNCPLCGSPLPKEQKEKSPLPNKGTTTYGRPS